METAIHSLSARCVELLTRTVWRGVVLLCGWALALSVSAAQTLRVGVYNNSPKINVAAEGKVEGIFYDVLEAIARKEGWTLQYVPGTFSEGLARLSTGEIDLMTDVALNSEREKLYQFHKEPVLASWNQIYTRRDSGIRSLLDLSGKRIAVLRGSMQQDYVQQMIGGFSINATLVPEPDFASAFRAVREGRADAVVTNRFYGARHAAASELDDTAIIFNPSQLYFAGSRSLDPEVLALLDRNLQELKKNSASPYHRSVERWTTGDLRTALPPWLKWAVLAAVVLLLASLAWGLALRRTALRLQQSEQRQRELASELERVFENSLDVICIFDADLRFLRVSEASLKVWGYRPDELVGRPYIDLVPPQDREATLSVARQVREGHAARDLESRSLRKDGSVVHIVWSAVWSPTEQRLYGVARDDSERRQLLGELQQRAQALQQSALQLEVAKDAAEAADRTKSVFLATMSHELRTPLNSIIGFTGIVVQGLAGPLNPEQAKQLGMVRDSARHLLALINDVLDISKIEAGELVVVNEPFDLAASIRKVSGIVAPLAASKELALEIAVAPSVGRMTGDMRRVEQILLNLLGNAIKFTESGSVKFRATLIDQWQPDASLGFTTLEAASAAPCTAVSLQITDTGIGIQPQDIPLLFKPFRQVDSALSRKHDGTGLGLAICRRLASLMGGQIEVSSVWQQGSTFTVTLPLDGQRQ
ncbi:transporter substrate-binding domain-containing protein [Polaromonas sp. YR568]|uniref:ATP-binding protein n=1 Tax=Polaromonas sp. YR568 TaxID=1855301 RepID=UPI0031376EDB